MPAYPSAIAAALTLAGAFLPVTDSHGQVAVTFTKQGAEIALSAEERAQVAERVRALIVGCAMTSTSYPAIFAGRALAKEWEEVRTRSHLYVRFPDPLKAQRTGVQISEVAIGFEDPRLIGPELTRHGGEVVGHAKCDGQRALALMCAPALRPHLLAGQETTCSTYDRIGAPR